MSSVSAGALAGVAVGLAVGCAGALLAYVEVGVGDAFEAALLASLPVGAAVMWGLLGVLGGWLWRRGGWLPAVAAVWALAAGLNQLALGDADLLERGASALLALAQSLAWAAATRLVGRRGS